jgi:hypothetical protein
MPTCVPTRLLSPTGAHPVDATPWLESAPHHRDPRQSLLIHPEDASLMQPTELIAIPFRAQSDASALREQLSIPIRLPR